MKPVWTLVGVLTLLSLGVARADDVGQKKSLRWTLTLDHGPLRIVTVESPTGARTTYHYIRLKVTNPTAFARHWVPLVKAITDTKKVVVATSHDEALDAIREQENDDQLVSVASTTGKIDPGQTYDAVAIFGPLDPLYDEVHVQVLGLADPVAIYKVERYDVKVETPSGATYTITNPESGETEAIDTGVVIQDVGYVERNREMRAAMKKAAGDGGIPAPKVEYWEVRERRVYDMTFLRPGDEFRPDDDLITAGREGWLVVGDVRLERQIQMNR